MRLGKQWKWAGLGICALLAANAIKAQEPAVPSQPVPLAHSDPATPPPPPPPPVHEAAPPETEGDGASWFSSLSLHGDYLLVRPRRNALDFAVSSPNVTSAPGGSVESLFWETRSGFSAGGSLPIGHGWEGRLDYSYFFSQGNRSLTTPDGGTLFATLSHGGFFDDVASAAASSSINYNVIDLELAKHLAVSDGLDLTLSGGGRFAWINQQFTAIYNGGSGGAVNAVIDSPVYFRGAGLSAGAEGFWKLGPGERGEDRRPLSGLGIYAKARGSILSGEFRNFLSETNNNGALVLVNVREKYQQLVPVMELGAGLAWRGEHWRLGVGYELANWFNMVDSLDFTSATSLGKPSRRMSDLTLEALAIQLELAF
jgi:hypothetical protein